MLTDDPRYVEICMILDLMGFGRSHASTLAQQLLAMRATESKRFQEILDILMEA